MKLFRVTALSGSLFVAVLAGCVPAPPSPGGGGSTTSLPATTSTSTTSTSTSTSTTTSTTSTTSTTLPTARVRVAMVGDSIFDHDCVFPCSLLPATSGGEEEIRPQLANDPAIDLVSYAGIYGESLLNHPGVASALAGPADKIVIDLGTNDGMAVGRGEASVQLVKDRVDWFLGQAAAVNKCVLWVPYINPTPLTTGSWFFIPNAKPPIVEIWSYIRARAAALPNVGLIDFGKKLDDRFAAGQGYPLDDRDMVHYLSSTYVELGADIRAAVKQPGCD